MSNIVAKLKYLLETKTKIKEAIINKGEEVSDTDTFRSYADKINNIYSEETTATTTDIASGKTAYVDGELITGTLTTCGSTLSLTCGGTNYMAEYDESLRVGAYTNFTAYPGNKMIVKNETRVNISVQKSYIASVIGLTSDMIKSGETVLGIEGTYGSEVEITDCSYLFAYNCRTDMLEDILSIVSKPTSMYCMFAYGNVTTFNSTRLTNLDLTSLDTSEVTTMYMMFYNCLKLTSLDVSTWDTSKVTTMYMMFYQCQVLTSLDLSGWDVSSVTTMYMMFYDCEKLTSIGDVSNWNTGKVTTMYRMFYNCLRLTSLDLSGWDVSSVTTMDSMFYQCSYLETLDVSGWVTSSLTTLYYTFFGCSDLTSLDLSNWDVSLVTTLYYTFYGCNKLTTIGDVSNWNTSKVTTMYGTFRTCYVLTSLDLSGWDVSNVTSMYQTFFDCRRLTSLDISTWDTSKVTTMYYMFYGCELLETIPVLDTSVLSASNSMTNMFSGCTSLSEESLNNILEMCINAVKITSSTYKKLSYIGLTEEQATICEGLSNFEAFTEAGWVTGY